jgi:transposase
MAPRRFVVVEEIASRMRSGRCRAAGSSGRPTRRQESYPDIIQLKARDLLVKNRTRLMNAGRGVLKSAGLRLSPCGTSCFPCKAAMCIPDELKPSLTPLLETISHLNKQIYSLDKAIESTAQNRYPETNRLRQIGGVGSITALQYVLTIETQADSLIPGM